MVAVVDAKVARRGVMMALWKEEATVDGKPVRRDPDCGVDAAVSCGW